MMWTGALNLIPDYWYLCDGTNGTPDLRDRFVMGAGGVYAPHNTGGAASRTVDLDMNPLLNHTHGFTDDGHVLTLAETPAHFHGSGATSPFAHPSTSPHGDLPVSTSKSIHDRGDDGVSESQTTTVGGGAAHEHSGTTDPGGGVTPVGEVTVPTVPPFFALAYIMKGV